MDTTGAPERNRFLHGRSAIALRGPVLLGLSTALSFGLLDAIYVLVSNAHELDRLAPIPSGVLAVAAAALLGYGLVVAALSALGVEAVDAGAAAGVLLAFLFAYLEDPLSVSLSFTVHRAGTESYVVLALRTAWLLVALTAAAGAAAILRLLRRGRAAEGLARAALVAPGVLLAITLALGVLKRDPHMRIRGAAVPGVVAIAGVALLAIGRRGRARAALVPWSVAALLFLGAVAGTRAWQRLGSAASAPAARHAIRRVVLITVDTLRADALGDFGAPAGASPAIDAISREGIVFKNATAPSSWTLPSLASIMTGVSPLVHEFHLSAGWSPGRGGERLAPVPTLAERMRRAGYRTAGFSANAIVRPGTNVTRGLGEYVLAPSGEPRSIGGRILGRRPADLLSGKSGRAMTAVVAEWIEKNAREDFFLWLHYFDPHTPYELPEELIPKAPKPKNGSGLTASMIVDPEDLTLTRAVYAAEVKLSDEGIGGVVSALRAHGLWDDALVVFTADHGEEFLDHGDIGHGRTLYQEILHVPLVVRLPAGAGAAHREIATPVDTTGIAPTVLELCGIPWDKSAMTSLSLTPFLGPAPPSSWTPIASTGVFRAEHESVLFDGMKYIRSIGSGAEELYDLARDPGETMSLARSAPERTASARALLAQFHADGERVRGKLPRGSESGGDDKETARQLKALGYVQ
jgi:arylsulfatase